eukprot:scaffold59124_cov17-Prasinocladus_malaysianus.AAC.1
MPACTVDNRRDSIENLNVFIQFLELNQHKVKNFKYERDRTSRQAAPAVVWSADSCDGVAVWYEYR